MGARRERGVGGGGSVGEEEGEMRVGGGFDGIGGGRVGQLQVTAGGGGRSREEKGVRPARAVALK